MLLVDPDSRVLLVNERLEIGSQDHHWIAPGGGVEAGETSVQAAVRELYEETGIEIELAADLMPVHRERVLFRFAGNYYDQTNDYFLVRVPVQLPVAAAALTEAERQVVLGHRWWSPAELAVTDARFEPLAIVELLQQEVVEG